MKYLLVQRKKDSEDSILIEKKEYTIRFSAKHAEHIVENKSDSTHGISFKEIVTLIKNSIILPKLSTKYVALGRHKNKIYETYFYLTKDRIDVVTSYLSNKLQLVELYKQYEKDNE
jgi:hypothetical protein